MDDYEIVVSGKKWIGEGIRSTNHVINELIDGSYERIVLTIYVLNDYNLLTNIENALKRDMIIDIFLNSKEKIIKDEILDKIMYFESEYETLNLYEIVDDLIHAKIVIVDKEKLLIGSANLTFSGLNKNYELGILINDQNVAYKVENIIRKLIE